MLDIAQFNELKASGNLPSPSGTALKILQLCQRDNVTLTEIIQVLQVDPVMVGRILKLANSAAYGRPRPVIALTPDVLMSIGIQGIRQVVLVFSLVSAHRQGLCPSFNYDEFWSRSVATGVAARVMGTVTRLAPPSELFTVGLLANIGRLALASLRPEPYGALLAKVGSPFSPTLSALETATFGFTQLEVGTAMMRDWGLPKLFTDAVLYHETPDKAPFQPGSRGAKLVDCLHFANHFASLCFMNEEPRRDGLAELLRLANKLDVTDDAVLALSDEILGEWRDWSAMLTVPVHELTTFTTLANSPAAKDVMAQPDPAFRLNVLIVDDDPTMCLLLQKLLTAMGHTVHVARDGIEGLSMAREHQPHIVITDLMMPREDGFALIQNLRSQPFAHYVYLVVITMLGDRDNLARAFELGADDYMSKPIEAKVLQARLRAGIRVVHEHDKLKKDQQELQHRVLELTIANQHSSEAALTDVLTGLHNRRYAMERLTQEWAKAERSQRPVSLLMMDIDHFKQVNDRFGHAVGDAILRQFADVLRSFARTEDIPCRFGGEEFLLIAPDTNLKGAQQLAERICSAIKHQTFVTPGGGLPVTVSIGVAEKTVNQNSLETWIKSADDALYSAKKSGRNQVAVNPR